MMRWIITLILLLHALPAFAEEADDRAVSPISLTAVRKLMGTGGLAR